MEYEKIINLGKIDYNNIGKKINDVTIEMTLKKEGEKNIFSCFGNIWNSERTDVIVGGQCLDEINTSVKNNKLFKEIYRLWKLYHLNDMHSGTEKQEKFLKENNIKNWASDYNNICNILEKNNLLYDNDYKFGSNWLYRPIPKKDLQKIYEIMEIN